MKKNDSGTSINTLIGEGAELIGDFSSSGSVRIDGRVDGNVSVTGTLILGASGEISGDVSATNVLIGGEVLGNIHASGKAELTGSARVLGDISTTAIVIDEHAVFQGRCDMNQEVPDKKFHAKNARALKEGRKTAKTAIEEALREVQEAENIDYLDEEDQEEENMDE